MNEIYMDLEKTLSKNGFIFNYFKDIEQVKEYLLEQISKDNSVGIGGSMTIEELDIYAELKEQGNKVYWHWKAENKKQELENAKNVQIYLASTNALTLDGKLVNMDGTGNRVASMIYGHDKVYIVVGKNKLCKDYDEAIERIENIAAPKNAKRLNLDTPCKFTGKCSDCSSPKRMCNVETILHKNPNGTQIYICLVDEALGY